jgi:hypothetical protein
MLDRRLVDLARPIEARAGEHQPHDPRAVFGPLLDFVEVPIIGLDRIVGFFVLHATDLASTVGETSG